MRILADENISGAMVKALRDSAYDVRWISEGDSGIDDNTVWSIAKNELRFLITSDKIFAGRCSIEPEAKTLGLMLLRIQSLSADEGALRVVGIISSHESWAGKLCVVGVEGVRVRQL
jgi:predicted nuclease of predicted toxin-antitoxin system